MNSLSIIVPVYNEEDNVAESYAEISSVLRAFGRDYEIIFVDDGSRDETLSRLSAVTAGDQQVRIIEFRRNFGQIFITDTQRSRMEAIVASFTGDYKLFEVEAGRVGDGN